MRYEKRITRQMLQSNPRTLFVFGDNMLRQGLGGQAKEMRGEPNAVGIPTKHFASMTESAFFRDSDVGYALPQIYAAFVRLTAHAMAGGEIVWPADGIGTGLAQLEQRSPKIWQLIEDARKALSVPNGER